METRRITVDQKATVWTRRVFVVPETMTDDDIVAIIDKSPESLEDLYSEADLDESSFETLYDTESVLRTEFIPSDDTIETASYHTWDIDQYKSE